jgi:hypothetical protein
MRFRVAHLLILALFIAAFAAALGQPDSYGKTITPALAWFPYGVLAWRDDAHRDGATLCAVILGLFYLGMGLCVAHAGHLATSVLFSLIGGALAANRSRSHGGAEKEPKA